MSHLLQTFRPFFLLIYACMLLCGSGANQLEKGCCSARLSVLDVALDLLLFKQMENKNVVNFFHPFLEFRNKSKTSTNNVLNNKQKNLSKYKEALKVVK